MKINKNHNDELYMEAEFFSPITPTANPPHHFGLESFTIGRSKFQFEAFHGTVPADYEWALDAGTGIGASKPPADCMTPRHRCALFE